MTSNSSRHDEIHDTWNVLAHTYRLMGRLWNKELSGYDFSREQALDLMIIKCLGDNATPYRISRFQAQEHNTVSDIIHRMEKQGLVTKIRESRGKSRVKVKLTDLGERAYSQSLRRDILYRIMSILSEKELEQLSSVLSKLRDEILKEFEKEQVWPEIRIPPSQWDKVDLTKITAAINSKETKSASPATRKSARKAKQSRKKAD
jgi:MarR family transcriptional regulator, organic hydroperoxide resistance regulator